MVEGGVEQIAGEYYSRGEPPGHLLARKLQQLKTLLELGGEKTGKPTTEYWKR
jgi:hypothetical protein